MSQKLLFELKNISIDKVNTSLFISSVFKNEKVNKSFHSLFGKTIESAIKTDSFKGDLGKKIELYSDGKVSKLSVYGLGVKNKFDSDKLRSLAANIVRNIEFNKVSSVCIDSNSFGLDDSDNAQAFSEGLLLGQYKFLDYKSKQDKPTLKKVTFIGNANLNSLNKGLIIGGSVNYARDLGNHPANILTPTYLANEAKEISKTKNFKIKIIDVKEFQKLGLGSFYSVARGAKEPAKFIIVEYSGGKKGDKPFGLIGKGLTFDTGGISLKPPARMDEMKFDMCGGATVFGLMKAVAALQPKLNIVFAVGASENMPGSDASRPGDIVKAYNGKTIEILNTDAEGRLVLADVLSYINKKYKPSAMIDFATLTGAVLVALGNRATGLMGNNEDLINQIKESGTATNEKVWQLPLWPEYSKDIKGKYADIQNIGKAGAGTITAGAFLKEFVGDTPWCHLDIAGTAWGPKEPSYQPKVGATGVAVRLIYDLIEKKS